MSYSRWSHSCWYVFSTVNTINDEPTIDINCEKSYPLSWLILNKQEVLDSYKTEYTEDDIKELAGLIDEFINDYKDEVK